MKELPINAIKLLELEDEAMKLGWYKKYPNKNFCYYVAEKMNELGNDNPSDEAIEFAKSIIEKLK